jgi:hypothetical protein
MSNGGWHIGQQEELIKAVKQVATQLTEIAKLLQTIANRLRSHSAEIVAPATCVAVAATTLLDVCFRHVSII